MTGSTRARWLKDRLMTGLCGAAVLVALVPLLSLLWLVVSRGVRALSFAFFTQLPVPVGEPGGGVGNGIAGTLYLVGLASLLGLPVGIGAGVFLAERGTGKLRVGVPPENILLDISRPTYLRMAF